MDTVSHPAHYQAHPSGLECIDVAEHLPFNTGNALKYIWRAGKKGDRIEDLRKAEWYLKREADRIHPGQSVTRPYVVLSRLGAVVDADRESLLGGVCAALRSDTS